MARLKSAPAERLASRARALHYALQGSATRDAAFQKLYAAVGPRLQEQFRFLESMLRAPDSAVLAPKALRLSSFATLAWLLQQTADPDRSAAALLGEYRRLQSFGATAIFAVWSEFAGFLSYLAYVLIVLVAIVIIYSVFVLPQMRSLYVTMDMALPKLTSLMFLSGAPLSGPLLMLAVLLVALLTWFVFRFRRQLRRYAPMPEWYLRLPLMGPVVWAYRQYLWLSYAGLLRATGMAAEQALQISATRLSLPAVGALDTLSPDDEDGPRGDLALASRLGRLDEELQQQQEACVDALLEALARCRRRSRAVLTILVFYLVAAFVAAMYMPIFSLGSGI
jgi:hypothetical protein